MQGLEVLLLTRQAITSPNTLNLARQEFLRIIHARDELLQGEQSDIFYIRKALHVYLS